MTKKILFVLKEGSAYGTDDSCLAGEQHSGLYWSAKFTSDMLKAEGIDANFVEVFDNSFIDNQIKKFTPDIVVIEALWVVPEKFVELKALNPNVEFVVLLHSDTPFLSNEPIATSWIKAYAKVGVAVATNSHKMLTDVKTMLESEGVCAPALYLPDYYPVLGLQPSDEKHSHISIGCYGAIRTLKNQMIQAIAAVKFADRIGKVLHFHVNGLDVNAEGLPILKNIRDLFAGSKHTLIEDAWVTHQQFLQSLKKIDIGMQVSLTETFCIVAADMVSSGVATVVSPEVVWAAQDALAQPTNGSDIANKLNDVWLSRHRIIKENHRGLTEFVTRSKTLWLQFVGYTG